MPALIDEAAADSALPLPDLSAAAAWAPALAHAFAGLACDLALVLDAQGRITALAPSAAAAGLPTADWLGRHWADTVSADTQAKIHGLMAEVLASGAARRREVTLAGSPPVPMAFAALRLGPAGPILAVGHDLRTAARLQQRFLLAQRDLEHGYQLALDRLKATRGSPQAAQAMAQVLPAAAELLGLQAGDAATLLPRPRTDTRADAPATPRRLPGRRRPPRR